MNKQMQKFFGSMSRKRLYFAQMNYLRGWSEITLHITGVEGIPDPDTFGNMP